MELSKTDLKVISEVGRGDRVIKEIAKVLNLSISQVYRVAKKLDEKGILTTNRTYLQPASKTHVNMLLTLLGRVPNLSEPLSGTGLTIFTTLLEPKTTSEIEKETGLHKTTILKKIRAGRGLSLLLIQKKKYRLNEKLWPDAIELIKNLKVYEFSIDKRVPVNSVIYHKTDKEIIFSTKEDFDAELTAFSAYGRYGIKLWLITNYYCLPKRCLTIREVFRHSLYIVEKELDINHLIFIALFYAKYGKKIKMKHPVLENLDKVLSGEKVPGYPMLAEIKDRANVYNIKV